MTAMKKKIFTFVAVAMSVLCGHAAEDLVLDVSQTVAFGDWGFSNVNAPTITLNNWSPGGGWMFDLPLSQNDYCGVDFSFDATTEKHVTFTISYENGATQGIDVPTGSTGIRADFAFDGDIIKLGFSYGDWEGGPEAANITINKALVVANGTGEVIELPFADIVAGDDCIKNEEDNSITFTRYSSYPSWVFDPALNCDEYEKVVITFAEPIPDEGILLNAESSTDEWSGTTLSGLTKGATKVTGFFSDKQGVDIKSIGFYYSWNNKQGTDDQTTLKIAKAELVKKSDSGDSSIVDIIANSDQEEFVIYNLYGQRVYNPTKGIFIKNGKKIMIH